MYVPREKLFRELENCLDSVIKSDHEAVIFLRQRESSHPAISKLREKWDQNYRQHVAQKSVVETVRLLLEYEDEMHGIDANNEYLRSSLTDIFGLTELREAERRESEFLEKLLRVLEDYASSSLPFYAKENGGGFNASFRPK